MEDFHLSFEDQKHQKEHLAITLIHGTVALGLGIQLSASSCLATSLYEQKHMAVYKMVSLTGFQFVKGE